MSLITDLLSKIKKQDSTAKADVPPLLKETALRSSDKQRAKTKIPITLVIALCFVSLGVGAVYFFGVLDKSIKKPQFATKTIPTPATPAASSQSKETMGKVAVTPEADKKVASAPQDMKNIPKTTPLKKSLGEPTGEWKEVRKKSAAPAENMETGKKMPDPRDKDFYLFTARSYEMAHDYHNALINYKRALEISPRNHVILNNISSVLIHIGSFEEAIAHAKTALQLKKDYVSAIINLGVAHSGLGNYKEGEAYMRQALSIDSSNRFALINLGLLHEKTNSLDKAADFYARLFDMKDPAGYLGLARIAEKQGRKTEAINFYREVVSMERKDSKEWEFANNRLWQLSR